MSVCERAVYMENGIALPKAEFCDGWAKINEWKNLDEEEFMNRYGDAKLALYNIPTQAELDQLEEHDEDLEGDEEDDGTDNGGM